MAEHENHEVITPELLPVAVAARIECPACMPGTVRLGLSEVAVADLGVWACRMCDTEWYEDGCPRTSAWPDPPRLDVSAVLESGGSR